MSQDTNTIDAPPARPSFGYGLYLLISGLIGLIASLALAIEKIEQLRNPLGALSCDVSILVQCSANLDSPQGALFGFPNPYLGLFGFACVICAGVTTWAAPAIARWYWLLFNLGVAAGLVMVLWLISQSVYVLGTLCPWCMVVWAVTIPMFIVVTLRNLRDGVFGAGLRALGAQLWPYAGLLVFVAVAVVVLLAQLRLDVAGNVFGL
ncbi:putative membrane protein [Kineosphaera limosa]|uniref:Vitamin K epoxide reductase domain-containing protein n=1 Tax=Kineosphaera limosa NBRC 100340 TaxID=1184609 RepID=K6WVR2_9MICO|nr:vitamin K epoxide reductase family protein [Kineosphaera limosa]NYD98825.1 putative membrane protein [Kineosphaera limosa]GAB96187.1 hypothetical protein KILIM_033_00070 [Kineosphaera limosa NBRC 100340]